MGEETEKLPYRVLVDDNFHLWMKMKRSEERAPIPVSTRPLPSAQKQIVDRYLEGELKAGMTTDKLYAQYRDFGSDPFIQRPAIRPVLLGMRLCRRTVPGTLRRSEMSPARIAGG